MTEQATEQTQKTRRDFGIDDGDLEKISVGDRLDSYGGGIFFERVVKREDRIILTSQRKMRNDLGGRTKHFILRKKYQFDEEGKLCLDSLNEVKEGDHMYTQFNIELKSYGD